jgi:transcription antitermination factor NusG
MLPFSNRISVEPETPEDRSCEGTLPATLAGQRGTEWYAIYTRHQHEKTVAQILTVKGLQAWLPVYETSRRWRDRVKVLTLPLFPCYVFIKGDSHRRLDVLTTPGVHEFVSTGGHPAPIPAEEVEAIRKGIASGARLEPHPLLRNGDWVSIKSGPLEGVQGILVRKKNLYRLILSVEMLGKAVALEVEASQIERLESRCTAAGVSTYSTNRFSSSRLSCNSSDQLNP